MALESAGSIGFGSCNRQNFKQDFWGKIQRHNLSTWIWTGDAFYSKNKSLAGQSEAILNLTSNESYQLFAKSLNVFGVWDDHDFGINDGGKYVPNYSIRRRNYINFLNSTAIINEDSRGLYTSKIVELNASESKHNVKIILLDTRSFREDPFFPAIGTLDFPFSALAGAAARALAPLLRLGLNHSGDMLGEEQWHWLANELHDSKAHFHVIISSIQVHSIYSCYDRSALCLGPNQRCVYCRY